MSAKKFLPPYVAQSCSYAKGVAQTSMLPKKIRRRLILFIFIILCVDNVVSYFSRYLSPGTKVSQFFSGVTFPCIPFRLLPMPTFFKRNSWEIWSSVAFHFFLMPLLFKVFLNEKWYWEMYKLFFFSKVRILTAKGSKTTDANPSYTYTHKTTLG